MIYYAILSLPILNLLDKLFYSVSADTPDRNKLPTNNSPWVHNFVELKKEGNETIFIHYVTLENSDPTKPLLLFVHGFPENWYSWRHQMKKFANEYYVVAIDMRGYNYSSKPRNRSDYSMEKLTEDIIQVITHFYRANPKNNESEQPKCILVAHDWGGAVAWNLLTHHSEYVDKFIVCNIPNPRLMFQNLQKNAAQVRRSWYIYFFQLPFLPERWLLRDNAKTLHEVFTTQLAHPESVNAEDVSEFQNAALIKGAMTGMINYYRNVFTLKSFINQIKKPKRSNSTSQKINVKTLMIWGEKDIALGKELTVGTDRYVEDITVKYIPDASHWVQQDTPQLVNDYMSEFLQTSQ